MSVPIPDRNKAKSEFDKAMYQVHDDAVNLIKLNFGAKGKVLEENPEYISSAKRHVAQTVFELVKYIRIANSIFPNCELERETRRVFQDKAIGTCFDLLVSYELVMHKLNVPDDKFTLEIKNIAHEINSIKKWRSSDNKRFKNTG